MNWWQITALACVQGLTEFLPVSSSGHLVIAEGLLQVKVPDLTEVNVILHAGTLASILVFYHRRILRLLDQDRRVILLLAVGTIPAAICGLIIKLYFKQFLEMPLVAGLMLPITGLMLLWVARRDGELDYAQLTFGQVMLIGLFQAFALLPGISRSGATIVGGLLVGLKRPEAATFSVLSAMPSILLAPAAELLDLLQGSGFGASLAVLGWGALVAFLVGLFALWAVVKVVSRGRLHWFAAWCIPLGIAVVIWQLVAPAGHEEPQPAPEDAVAYCWSRTSNLLAASRPSVIALSSTVIVTVPASTRRDATLPADSNGSPVSLRYRRNSGDWSITRARRNVSPTGQSHSDSYG